MASDQTRPITPQARLTESACRRPPIDVTEKGADHPGKETRNG